MVQWADSNPTMSIDHYVDWDDYGLESPQRSAFVSVVAWIFMVLGVVGALFIAASLYLTYTDAHSLATLQRLNSSYYVVMFATSAFVLFVSLMCFVSGYGLRKRRNWGRLSVSALLAISLLLDLFWFLMLGNQLVLMAPHLPSGAMGTFFLLFGAEMALATLKAWMFYKLQTFPIKQECSTFAGWDNVC